jgi:hypothetical protein
MGLNPWIGLNRLQPREREAGAVASIRSNLKWDMLSSLSYNHPKPRVITMDQRMTGSESLAPSPILSNRRSIWHMPTIASLIQRRHRSNISRECKVAAGKISGSLVNQVR